MHDGAVRGFEGDLEGVGACRVVCQCQSLARSASASRASASSHVAHVVPAAGSVPSSIDGRWHLHPLAGKALSDRRQILKRTIENLTGLDAAGPGGCEAGVPRVFARSCPIDGSTAQVRPRFFRGF